MCGLMKTGVRVGIIGALAGTAIIAIAGPHRVGALVHQARHAINDQIDEVITDPVALRAKLTDLESQYPSRIGSAQSDLIELQEQIDGLRREQIVSERVVEMANADLGTLGDTLARAKEAKGTYGIVRVKFNNQSLSMDEAYGRATRISQTRDTHLDRVNTIQRDVELLEQQEARLVDELTRLENEYQTFQSEIAQLDRQIEAVERNDRLITMLERRQRVIDEHSRYTGRSLDDLRSSLASKLQTQEMRIASLGIQQTSEDYEARAKAEVDLDLTRRASKALQHDRVEIEPVIIEIGPEEGTDSLVESEPGDMASRD